VNCSDLRSRGWASWCSCWRRGATSSSRRWASSSTGSCSARSPSRPGAAGAGRGWILFLDGAPIAYLYSPIRDGAVIYEYLGYDPAHRDLSVGTVLQYLVLERLFAEGGFSVFDFTEGGGQHKEMFATGSVEVADLYFFRRNLAAAAIVGGHVAAAEVTRTAIATLDRLQARDRLRRWLRRGA